LERGSYVGFRRASVNEPMHRIRLHAPVDLASGLHWAIADQRTGAQWARLHLKDALARVQSRAYGARRMQPHGHSWQTKAGAASSVCPTRPLGLERNCAGRLPRGWLILGLALLSLAAGCSRKIGDACTISTDCSVTGDRLCDTTEPGGYCTQFNCEPNSCPDDSVCVLFADNTCTAATQSIRFRRTFCMATCESDGDCRAGYRCLDMTREPGRSVVDLDPRSLTVCIVPQSSAPAPTVAAEEPAICGPAPLPSDGGAGSEAAADAPSESSDASSSSEASSSEASSSEASSSEASDADAALPDGSAEGAALDAPRADAVTDASGLVE
jgi:hypothetical protein